MVAAIEVSGLVKTFGRVRALDGLDFTVEHGEVHAFLGPNGSGKSTTIRVLLGLLRSDEGVCNVLGGHPWRDAVELHRRMAYVPGDVNLWPNLSGGEAIDLMLRMRGGAKAGRRAELIERFDLDVTKQARSYSKGNRQKVALVAALASDVELYIFDEPTSGLDPLMEQVFQQCVAELRAAGRTVLLSSHILSQVERLSDSVTIIRSGKAVQSDRLDQLQHLHRIRMNVRLDAAHSEVSAGEVLAALPGVHDVRVEGQRLSFSLDREHTPEVLRSLAYLGTEELVSAPLSLEELFMHEYAADEGTLAVPGREAVARTHRHAAAAEVADAPADAGTESSAS